jgi:hypothetical protein
MDEDSLNRPVFIIGCPRSGNTLLGCILNKHPEFLIFFEQNVFSALYRRWDYQVRKGEDPYDTFLRLTERYCSDIIEAAGISVLDYRASVRNTEGSWREMLNEFAEAAVSAGKPSARRFGDKTPHHIARVDIITEHYPEAQFLFVYRDPRDTVYSMSKESFPYASNTPAINAHVVDTYYSAYREPIEDGLPDNVLGIRYESLVRQPEEVVRDICQFLGVEYTSKMLEAEIGTIQKIVGAGWVDYKGWGEVRPQESSRANPLQENPTINWMLSEWIEELGYNGRARSPTLYEQARSQMKTGPIRLQEALFQVPWKMKYPGFEPFLLEKPVSVQQVRSWLTGGE